MESAGLPPMLLEQLGIGGVFGACVGYTAKKATRLAAIILGLTFVLIQVLAYYHLVTPHWDRVQGLAQSAAASGPLARFMGVLLHNIPFAGAFVIGFAIGFRKG